MFVMFPSNRCDVLNRKDTLRDQTLPARVAQDALQAKQSGLEELDLSNNAFQAGSFARHVPLNLSNLRWFEMSLGRLQPYIFNKPSVEDGASFLPIVPLGSLALIIDKNAIAQEFGMYCRAQISRLDASSPGCDGGPLPAEAQLYWTLFPCSRCSKCGISSNSCGVRTFEDFDHPQESEPSENCAFQSVQNALCLLRSQEPCFDQYPRGFAFMCICAIWCLIEQRTLFTFWVRKVTWIPSNLKGTWVSKSKEFIRMVWKNVWCWIN